MFDDFAKQVSAALDRLQKQSVLHVVDVPGDDLYATYLTSFPAGSNPLVRTRTEHDCSTCRAFLKNVAGVVHVDPQTLKITTIWDGDHGPVFGAVAAGMRDMVLSHARAGQLSLWRARERRYGTEKTVRLGGDGHTETYRHFHATVTPAFHAADGADVGAYTTSVDVLTRALETIDVASVETVLDLIGNGSLYRGTEHRARVQAFLAAQKRYHALPPEERPLLVAALAPDMTVSRFSTSVIGTLAEDLAGGMDADIAVRAFESKVAPQNYQRTNQVVTQRMVNDALTFIEARGLKVGRRMARLSDLSVRNVLWVNGNTRPQMKEGLAGILAGAVVSAPVRVSDAVTDIGIEAFLQTVLPGATRLRVLVEPQLAGAFVTLTTATEEGGPPLFKWPNNFAWNYSGDAADAITARVKAAGGNVSALLRVSLSWDYDDDLDLHCRYPGGTIYYGEKSANTRGVRGTLDVDMNAFTISDDPVENIAFTQLVPGTYTFSVNNFRRRSGGRNFTVQVAHGGGLETHTYPQPLAHGRTVDVVRATVDRSGTITVTPDAALTRGAAGAGGSKWGVPFSQYAEVSAVTLSPNHWDDHAIGNKHVFFLLEGARSDERPRGIYNEFLSGDLTPHRRVFDVIGERTRPEIVDDQLSGIGISSTLGRAVTVEVTSTAGNRRPYRVQF